MREHIPIQKEFGEIVRFHNKIQVKKIGTESISGQIVLHRETKPVPYVLASWLWITSEDQGKGLASQLLAEVEKISREEGIPAVLHDDVKADQNPKAIGMYAKRPGWNEIANVLVRPNGPRTYRTYVFGDSSDKNTQKLIEHFSSSVQ